MIQSKKQQALLQDRCLATLTAAREIFHYYSMMLYINTIAVLSAESILRTQFMNCSFDFQLGYQWVHLVSWIELRLFTRRLQVRLRISRTYHKVPNEQRRNNIF